MALSFPLNPTNGQVYDDYVFSATTGAWNRRSLIDDIRDDVYSFSDNILALENNFPVSIANGGTASTNIASARNTLGIGLVPVIPPSVLITPPGGVATANSLGKISFTSATSVSLNGIFSSSYVRYKMLLNIRTDSGSSVDFFGKFRTAGTDITNGYYGSAIYNAYNASVTNSAQFTNTASGYVGYIGTLSGSLVTLEIFPDTGYSGWSMHCRNTAAASQHIGGFNAQTTTMPDGFTVYSASAFTGTAQVFGYNS